MSSAEQHGVCAVWPGGGQFRLNYGAESHVPTFSVVIEVAEQFWCKGNQLLAVLEWGISTSHVGMQPPLACAWRFWHTAGRQGGIWINQQWNSNQEWFYCHYSKQHYHNAGWERGTISSKNYIRMAQDIQAYSSSLHLEDTDSYCSWKYSSTLIT